MSADSPQLTDNPLVSIVIPCYKQAHFLREAIESCLAQTYPQCEIIVVDDGSPDDTASVASSYNQVLCVRQENQGLRAARNRGLKESKGEYLIFLDSDDRLRPTAAELGVKHLSSVPSAAFAYGRCNFIGSDGEFLFVSKQPTVRSKHYERLLSGNIISHPGEIIFRRGPLEDVGGFQPDVNGAEDYDLCLRLARSHGACCYDDIVSDYRQHDNGLSQNAAIMAASIHKILMAQVPFVQGNTEQNRALKKGIRNWRRNHLATSLVFSINQNVREKQWSSIPANLVALFLANPTLLFENGIRKTKLELKRLTGRLGIFF